MKYFSERLFDQSISSETYAILILASVFFMAGLVVMAVLFISRLRKSYVERASSALSIKLQAILNSIIVNSVSSESVVPESAWRFHLSQIESLVSGSSFKKRVLINQIVRLKKNLSGASAQVLEELYKGLQLQEVSLKGLNSFRWFTKARAMRELTEMSVAASAQRIQQYLHSSNVILREEAFIALANLRTEQPLFFLEEYSYPITDWMQLNVHAVLQKTETRNLPDFSRWFDHQNKSVRLFALRMATQFRQYQSSLKFAQLLEDPDDAMRYHALKALKDLEITDYTQSVLLLKDVAWRDEKLGTVFLQYLGMVMMDFSIQAVLQEFAGHPSYTLRFEATKSLLGHTTQTNIPTQSSAYDVSQIIKHLSEPLLR